jgi:hypothetical protein
VIDPWVFGWSQVLSIFGLLLTAAIAYFGFRSFERWKRERLEEKRIDVAFETLALAYEADIVFGGIRMTVVNPAEYKDMPRLDGESEKDWEARGLYYAISGRVRRATEYFDRVVKVQPRCMALFGPEVERVFGLVFEAREEILTACELLIWDLRNGPGPTDEDKEFWKQLRADVFRGHGKFAREGDRVGAKLKRFRQEIEEICRPTIDREYGKVRYSFAARA